MRNVTRFTSVMISAFLVFGVLVAPGITQDSSDSQAVDLLKSAAKKSLESSSYTMTIDQNIKQTQSMSNMTINQKNTGSVKYEKPYMYINMTSDVSGTGGQGKEVTKSREIMGKLDDNDELIGLYQKSSGPGGWKKMKESKAGNFKKMFDRFRNASALPERLKNVQFDGEETINGTACRKLTAEQKEEAIQEAAKEMMKGSSQNKLLQNMKLSVDVKESNMDIWVRKDSSLIEKIDVKTKQTISMEMSIRGNKRSFDMDQDLDMTSTFKDYNSTTVPQKYRDAIEKKIKQANQEG